MKLLFVIALLTTLVSASDKQLLFVTWSMNINGKSANGRQAIESPFKTVEDINNIEKYLFEKCKCTDLILTNIVPIGIKTDTVYIHDTVRVK